MTIGQLKEDNRMRYPRESIARTLAGHLSLTLGWPADVCASIAGGLADSIAALWPDPSMASWEGYGAQDHDECGRCGVFLGTSDNRANGRCRECASAERLERIERRRKQRAERLAAGEELCVAAIRQDPKGELCLNRPLRGADRCPTHLPSDHNAMRCKDMGYAYADIGLPIDEVRERCASLHPDVAELVWSHAWYVETREASERGTRYERPVMLDGRRMGDVVPPLGGLLTERDT